METLCPAYFLLLLLKLATWVLSDGLINLFFDIALPHSYVAIDSSLLFLRQVLANSYNSCRFLLMYNVDILGSYCLWKNFLNFLLNCDGI